MTDIRDRLAIRQTIDQPALADLYTAAFPTEDLMPLVKALVARADVLSLCAFDGERLIGHILFTDVGCEGMDNRLSLLGPLAVAPTHQRQGVGRALIKRGLEDLTARGIQQILVLGDPAYYGKSGFQPHARMTPPYPLPADWHAAWQWQRLDGVTEDLTGQLVLPEPWMRAALWG